MSERSAEKAEPCPNDCDRGLIACWSPGGPCSPAERATPCDLCGPCFHCRPGEHPMDDRANPPETPTSHPGEATP